MSTKQIYYRGEPIEGRLFRAMPGGEGPWLYVKRDGDQPESVNADGTNIGDFRGVPVCRDCHKATFGEYCPDCNDRRKREAEKSEIDTMKVTSDQRIEPDANGSIAHALAEPVEPVSDLGASAIDLLIRSWRHEIVRADPKSSPRVQREASYNAAREIHSLLRHLDRDTRIKHAIGIEPMPATYREWIKTHASEPDTPKITEPQLRVLKRAARGEMFPGIRGSTRRVLDALDRKGLIAVTRQGSRLVITDLGRATLSKAGA